MRATLPAVVVAALVSLIGIAATGQASPGKQAGEQPRGRYIVVLHDDTDSRSVADEHSRRHGVAVSHVYRHALQGYAAEMSQAAAEQISQDPRVRWVQGDRRVRTTGQTTPTGVDRVNADDSSTADIDEADDQRVEADVAVLDTGVDLDHPDLNVHTDGAQDCTTGVSANDNNGHGTHVSGTAAAVDDNKGVVGVAPGARVWPVKVLTATGVGLTSQVICGVDYVTKHADQIEVANMSLGGDGSDDGNCGRENNDALHRAICRSVRAGVTYTVAAGNAGEDAKNTVPAAYDEVITTSALADFNGEPGGGAEPTCREDQDDTFADFSNYGTDIDLIAPGVCIRSTWNTGGYHTASGTSMAAPHVAGGAALYTVNNPDASPSEVTSALQDTGSTNWIWPSQDPDGIQEKLLNVSTL